MIGVWGDWLKAVEDGGGRWRAGEHERWATSSSTAFHRPRPPSTVPGLGMLG